MKCPKCNGEATIVADEAAHDELLIDIKAICDAKCGWSAYTFINKSDLIEE